jgi:hypothetical protein
MSLRAKFILGLILLVAVLGGVWFLLQPKPAQILADAKRKFLTARSVTYDLTFDLKGAVSSVLFAGPSAPGRIQGHVKSSIDLSRYPYASESTWKFDVTGPGAPAGTWTGESRKKDGLHYFRLESPASNSPLAQPYLDRWYRSARPAWSRLVTSPDLVTGEPSLQASSAKDLRQALVDASWLKYVSRLPDAKTADGPMYHFRVSLDDDAMTAVLLKLQELRQGSTTPDDQAAATLAVSAWNDPVGEILISKKDGLPRHLEFTAKVSGEHGETSLDFAVDFSGYGQRVAVEIPEAVDLDQTSSSSPANSLFAPSGTRAQAPGSASATIPTPTFNADAAKLQQAVNALVNNFAPKPSGSGTNSKP